MATYRGVVYFGLDSEYEEFKKKVDNYYSWCTARGFDSEDDENYIAFCESRNSL
jgi:hypothetical protein